ncbi:MAG: diguanylate cyclase [Thiotrichales bacterium]|nr:diguanylate cyclase [Thiotrichales bacterium]
MKKAILKLVFSCAGLNPGIDGKIDLLKTRLRNASKENERCNIIAEVVDELLPLINGIKENQIKCDDHVTDHFNYFLQRLSEQEGLQEEITRLSKQANEIREEQQYLDLIEKTVGIICANTGSEEDCKFRLLHMIEQFSLPSHASVKLHEIRNKLINNEYPSLKEVSGNISRVINEINSDLQKQLDDIQQYLNRLLAKLSVLYGHFQSTQRDLGQSCKEAEDLSREFQEENHKLHDEIKTVTDIKQLKSSIDEHMSRIQKSMDAHLEAEQQRKQATEERVDELKSRLQEMENETLNLKEKLNQEQNNALNDVLTGIPNRLAYEEQINKEIARASRYQQALTMAVIDIDHFKKINDRFGHKAGDKVLKAVATVCKENIRDTDFFARYGGEEFVLLLPETDLDEAGIAVENLRRVVESCNFYHQNQTVLVTVSIGYAEHRNEDDIDSLFNRADMALYAAKGSGRNRCMSDIQIDDAA